MNVLDWNSAPRTSVLIIAGLVSLLLMGSLSAIAEMVEVHGRVIDETTDEPIAGANITISDRDNGTVLARTVTDANGWYSVSGPMYGWLTIAIQSEGYENISKDIYVEVVYKPLDKKVDVQMSPVDGPRPQPPPETPPYFQYGALAAIVMITSLVMYSKIKKENLLRHAVRRRIYDYIKENPGQHYRAILNDLGLPMGVLTYHVNRLEKGEYLRSRQDGMYRRFFVTGRKTEVRFFLSEIQESILATIQENQGISQSKIAERISVSRKVVNYHVNILDQAGLIYMESQGRETACYAVRPKASSAV
jgi:DNA-binding MarR family transcriptional regulator